MQEATRKRAVYASSGKRMLDLLASSMGLVWLLPLFLLVALLLKLTSPGPVFFKQARAGRDGYSFKIIKFRTMRVGADKHGPVITAHGDPRVTPLGKLLRTLKIDELPQLWNVLKGDMSLVGPRPEVPLYVTAYTEEQRKVLIVRPGLTDPASLAYINEEELLSGRSHPEGYYQEVILPHKLSLNLEYIRRMSLRCDLALLMKTLFSVFFVRGAA